MPLMLLILACIDVQELLDAAVREGRPRVVIPAGTYRLPSNESPWCVRLRDAKDLVIEAKGVEFVVPDPHKGALQFFRCRNVTLTGLSLRHETPPFSQGQIEAIAEDELSYDVRLHAGYPDPEERPTAYLFDPKTRQWKPGAIDVTPDRVARIGERRIRLHFGRKSGASLHRVDVGDLIAFRGRVVTDLHLGASSRMTIEDVTIRHGSGFGIHEDGGDGGNRYRYTVTYGPTPEGATEAPLLSCNADAFHSSGVRKGPVVEGCRFEGMGDDGIPIHGAYALVVESREKSLIVTEGVLREGDPIRLFNADGGRVDEGRVVTIRRIAGYTPPGKSRFEGFADLAERRFVEVTTEPPMQAGFDWQASNPAALGSGFVVRDNVIRNHRARGILIKAEDGLIERNTIEGSTIAGIVLSPELYWREACYSRNVTIRNNTIRRCGAATAGPWTRQAGALTVTAEVDAGTTPGHRNIVIEGNRFVENDGVNLQLESVDGAVVKANRFERPCRSDCRRGSGRKIDPGALIWLSNCRDVRLDGNRVEEAGGALLRKVGVGPDVADLVGLETGVTSSSP